MTSTAEGSTIYIDSMIFWKIFVTAIATKNAMEILKIDEADDGGNHHFKDQHSAIKASSKTIISLR